MAAWNTLIDDALGEIGVLALGDTGTTAQRTLGLSHVNRILGLWSIELGPIYFETTESLTWASGNASRTIGSGGNLNTTRPVKIHAAQFRIGDEDYNLEIVSYQKYQALPDKAETSTHPELLAYNPTNASSLGTLFIWPVPSDNLTFRLTSLKPFATITDGTAETGLPPGYEPAIVAALSESLCNPFGAKVTQEIKQNSARTYRAICMSHMTFEPSNADPLMPGQRRAPQEMVDRS